MARYLAIEEDEVGVETRILKGGATEDEAWIGDAVRMGRTHQSESVSRNKELKLNCGIVK